MALKIIKGFFAFHAAVHGFAGRRAELGNQLGMVRLAVRTLNGFFSKHIRSTKLLLGIWRCNTKSFQLLLASICHPIGGPGG